MSAESQGISNVAWMNGREIWDGSSSYGEVVIPSINVFENPGSLPDCRKKIGEVNHGQEVDILESTTDKKSKVHFFKISFQGLAGWVSEPFVSSQWSSFTFLGNILPKRACVDLESSVHFAGMQLMLRAEGFAVLTEGNPAHFNSIIHAAMKFVKRLLSAQSPLTQTALTPEFTNWVEVSLSRDTRTIELRIGKATSHSSSPAYLKKDRIRSPLCRVSHIEAVTAW